MRRKNKYLGILLLLSVVIGIIFFIPLIISISYGNIPFINNNYLFSSDVIVSSSKKLSENNLFSYRYKTYTWSEVKSYIISREMTYSHVLRDTLIVIGAAFLAIITDRIFARKKY